MSGERYRARSVSSLLFLMRPGSTRRSRRRDAVRERPVPPSIDTRWPRLRLYDCRSPPLRVEAWHRVNLTLKELKICPLKRAKKRKNKELIERLYVALNKSVLGIMEEFWTEDMAWYGPGGYRHPDTASRSSRRCCASPPSTRFPTKWRATKSASLKATM